jgi:hypothetical protein
VRNKELQFFKNDQESDRVLQEARAYRDGITQWARTYARRPRRAGNPEEIRAAAMLDLRRWSSAYFRRPIASIREPRSEAAPASGRDARVVSVA